MSEEILTVDSIMKNGVKGYQLENRDKVDRVINGVVNKLGRADGGLGIKASAEKVLAEYDRIGGYIKKGKYKVSNGSFWDSTLKKAIEKPDVMLEFRDIGGNLVLVPEKKADDLPLEVQAAEIAKEQSKKKSKKK